MKKIIISENLKSEDISYKLNCSRAILVDNDNVLVERHLDGSILLPGIIYVNSDLENLLKHLNFKLGVDYSSDDLIEKILVEHFQSGIQFDDTLISREVITKYFLGKFKGIDYTKIKDFDYGLLKLIDIDDVIEITSKEFKNGIVDSNNRETNKVLKMLKKDK